MKKLMLKLFCVAFSFTLLFMSYASFKGIFDWFPWYVDGANVLEVNGKVTSVTWSGGKSSCHCWIIRVLSNEKSLFFNSYKNGYTGGLPKVNDNYLFKYQLDPGDRYRPVAIFSLKSQERVYSAESDSGFRTALLDAVSGLLTFTLSIFSFLVFVGVFNKHITYPE